MVEIIGQAIGIAGMFFNVISFQGKSARAVMLMQFCAATLFSISYFMIDAPGAAMLNAIAVARAAVYANKEKCRADKTAWLVIFIALYVASYIITFTVFDKPHTVFNFVIELLPVIALTVTTIGFKLQSAKIIRRFGIVNSVSWLIYNIINFAIGGILCEVFCLVSIVIGIFRLDRKRES